MKTIIVPTDFSPAALNAAYYAADMAKAIDAGILLLHVFYVLVSYTEVPPIIDESVMRENVELKMDELKQQLEHTYGDKLNISAEIKMGGLLNQLESLCN